MKRLILAAVAMMAVACGASQRPPVVTPTTPPTNPTTPTTTRPENPEPSAPPLIAAMLKFDLVGCRTVPADNYCAGPAGVQFRVHTQLDPPIYIVERGDDNGYVFANDIPATVHATDITITAPGYDPITVSTTTEALIANNDQGRHNFFPLHASHFDPSTLSLEQLAAIRGSMWTARLNIPFGPRPNQPDNILALDFYELFDVPTRARMLQHYSGDLQFTHAVTGPLTGNDCYHGQYPCRQSIPTQAEFDAYLDTVQEWWDGFAVGKGPAPVYFHKPDGWERYLDGLDALDALCAQPRAQKLLRIVIYPGWEPSGSKYGWNNSVYVDMLTRGARVFPNALRGLHTVADLDAPIGGDDDPIVKLPDPKSVAWKNVTPLIHFWAVQVGGYVGGCCPQPTADFLREFAKLWPDYIQRFENEWNFGSAWGPGRRIRVIYAEGASFGDYWQNWPESVAFDLGDLAMQSGADGYLDGGRVAVPVKQ